jgi:hypothetical protein
MLSWSTREIDMTNATSILFRTAAIAVSAGLVFLATNPLLEMAAQIFNS